MAVIAKKTGIILKHMPFKSGTQGMLALKGGHVHVTVASENEIRALAGTLEVRPLVTSSALRSSIMTETPTLSEMGYDVALENHKGLVAPAGTPKDRIEKLHDAFKKACERPELIETFRRLRIEGAYLGPGEFGMTLAEMYEQVGRAVGAHQQTGYQDKRCPYVPLFDRLQDRNLLSCLFAFGWRPVGSYNR
jgi:tripartite-type tricarboxylate transporter receptor subunit TctC